jgi:hypothetical protein
VVLFTYDESSWFFFPLLVFLGAMARLLVFRFSCGGWLPGFLTYELKAGRTPDLARFFLTYDLVFKRTDTTGSRLIVKIGEFMNR